MLLVVWSNYVGKPLWWLSLGFCLIRILAAGQRSCRRLLAVAVVTRVTFGLDRPLCERQAWRRTANGKCEASGAGKVRLGRVSSSVAKLRKCNLPLILRQLRTTTDSRASARRQSYVPCGRIVDDRNVETMTPEDCGSPKP